VKVDFLVLGDFQTNCYVLREADAADRCLILDPGFGGEQVVAWLAERQCRPGRILITHGHCDHVAGLPILREAFGPIPTAIGRGDADLLADPRLNLSALLGEPFTLPPAEQLLDPGDVVEFGALRLKVLPTPGHTPGGLSFYAQTEQAVFSGDSLFADSIGRHDFPGGNQEILLRSIREQILSLPDQTRVYPGHGPITTVGREKRTNPFFRQGW